MEEILDDISMGNRLWHKEIKEFFDQYMPLVDEANEKMEKILLNDKYVEKHSTIGNYVARSGIFDALHTEGVQKVVLTSPAADIATTKEQAPVCTEINIEFVIADDTNQ